MPVPGAPALDDSGNPVTSPTPNPILAPPLNPDGSQYRQGDEYREFTVSTDTRTGETIYGDRSGNRWTQDNAGRRVYVDAAGRPIAGQVDLVTSHRDAHAIRAHGGIVTDAELILRARTGLTPDGRQSRIPVTSSAFDSDALLRFADQRIRDDGTLQAAIAAELAINPNADRVEVTSNNLGVNLGRGYQAVGSTNSQRATPNRPGPVRRVDNLQRATARYELNRATGQWETVTIFPVR